MTHKEKVKAKFPRAFHQRFTTHGGRGYTLIWNDHRDMNRLAEGKTTAQAWKAAAAAVNRRQYPPGGVW